MHRTRSEAVGVQRLAPRRQQSALTKQPRSCFLGTELPSSMAWFEVSLNYLAAVYRRECRSELTFDIRTRVS